MVSSFLEDLVCIAAQRRWYWVCVIKQQCAYLCDFATAAAIRADRLPFTDAEPSLLCWW
jgi:hypothetical protein